jgi:hypothetical protein
MVEGHEALRDALRSEMADDAHVLGAAVVGKADMLVTNNLKDFPALVLKRYHLEAQSADAFLVNQWWLGVQPCASVAGSAPRASKVGTISASPLSARDGAR